MIAHNPFRQTYRCKACGTYITADRILFISWIKPTCPECKKGSITRLERHGCVILEHKKQEGS